MNAIFHRVSKETEMRKRTFTGVLTALLAAVMVMAFTSVSAYAAKKMATEAHGKYAYFAVQNSIYRLNTSSGSAKKIRTFDQMASIGKISYYKGYLYFSANLRAEDDGSDHRIYRVTKQGRKLKELAYGTHPRIYNGKLYYAAALNAGNEEVPESVIYGIARMSLTGKKRELLVEFPEERNWVFDLEVIGGRIYYEAENTLYSVKTNGKGQIAHMEIREMLSDGNAVYFATEEKIGRFTVNTGISYLLNRKLSEGGEALTWPLYVKGGYLYYLEEGYEDDEDALWRIRLGTGKKKKLKELCVTGIAAASGAYMAVRCAMEDGLYVVARMKTTGKKYKRITSYYLG